MRMSKIAHKLLLILLILILLILSIGMTQGTLGKFAKSFILSDSAKAIQFNVTITTPKGFITEQGITSFEYYFISETDIIALKLQAHNDGEIDVICTPHVNNDIKYRIFIDGVEQPEFTIRAKETVDFYLALGPEGLTTDAKNAEFFIDLKQIEE